MVLTLKRLVVVVTILVTYVVITNAETVSNSGVIEDICIFDNEYGKALRVGFHPSNSAKVILYIPASLYTTDPGFFRQMHAQLLEAASNKRTVELIYTDNVIKLINTLF